MDIKTTLKQSQNMVMTPQLQQAVRLLSLSKAELEDFLHQELLENPCLQENFLSFKNPGSHNKQASGSLKSTSPSHDTLSNAVFYHDLQGELRNQLRLMPLSKQELENSILLTEYLDDRGYLCTPLADISATHSVTLDALHAALCHVQKCDPIGVGARSSQECLLLQLKQIETHPLYLHRVLANFWEDFQKQNVKKISDALQLSEQVVQELFHFAREHLDPNPARAYGQRFIDVAAPDVYIFKRDGQWQISLDEEGLPRLKIAKRFENLIEKAQSNEDKKFLQEKLKSAHWLLKAFSERNKTLLRVTEAIVQKQQAFFDKGRSHLKPYTLKELAKELGLHESTVSRATSQKYLHCPQGLFELKYFFSSGLETSDGETISNETVKAWIQAHVHRESLSLPLSDQELSQKLEKELGVSIARRTVAKYRQSLGIASATQRRKNISHEAHKTQ